MNSFDIYRVLGHRFVSGWLESEVLDVLAVLDSAQRARGSSGAVAEVGVHHGKLFIGLNLLRQGDEKSVAIDVFDDQELNVDGSGKGNLAVFCRNIKRWSSSSNVEVYQGDSTLLKPEKLLELAGGDIRLFSVDGGHTAPIVLSDMKLAENTLARDGIVIADDVFNQNWPGVSVGTLRYMDGGGKLVPFGVGFNKVFFSSEDCAPYYRDAIHRAFSDRLLIATRNSEFDGHPVEIVYRVPRRPSRLAGRIGPVRAIRHRLQPQPS